MPRVSSLILPVVIIAAVIVVVRGPTDKPAVPGDEATVDREDLAGQPLRIIATGPSTVEMLFALGAGDTLVGVSAYAKYPPETAIIPKVGGLVDPDLEQVLALDPTLIITRGTSTALSELCQEHGIRIFHDPTDALPDIYRTIRSLGDLVGRSERAEELCEQMQRDLDAIHASVRDLPVPDVLVTMRSPDSLNNIISFGRKPYFNDLIAIAGGRNIFGTLDIDYPQISTEEILARKPDVIIEIMFDVDVDQEFQDSVASQWRQLGPIPAVDAGRVHIITETFITIPSPRIVQSAQLLADLIHPGHRSDAHGAPAYESSRRDGDD